MDYYYMPMDGFEDEMQRKCLDEIEYAKNLYEAQVDKVEREEYIRDLLRRDYVAKIRNNRSRYDYIRIFRTAQKQVGEKLKKNRTELETLKSFILNDFLDNDKKFKLTSITSCGFEDYGWEIDFTGYGKTIKIYIPIMANLDTDNIEDARFGKFVFSVKTSEHSWSVLKKSYKIKDISEFIKECFKDAKEKE